MKHLQKITNCLQIFLLILAVVCLINACGTTSRITLTPEQQNVKILDGNQTTTLELMETHTPISTEKFTSEYAARVRAVILDADVAQLILHYTGGDIPYTYRFWKPK